MLKKLLKLVVLLLIANAIYQCAPPFWRYTKFNERVQDVAMAAKGKSDYAITTEVLQVAGELKVPLTSDAVQVSRSRDLTHTYVEASWREELDLAPRWKYVWNANVKADGWHVRAIRPEDLR